MIQQPKRGDGEEAWRRYAAELRERIGELSNDLKHVKRISVKRNGLLNRISRLLDAGDVQSAIDRLARRTEAKERRQ